MADDKTSAGSVVDDRFVLLSRLGQGGGATVWLAQDSIAGREVALKLVHAHLRRQARAIERFAREAAVLLELDHPHIARCHAFNMESATPYIAMDYVKGHSLKDELGRRATTDRHFTTALLLRLFTELTSAVEYAHSKNVLHRDLSAANVLLDMTGDEMSARIVDFGVAKLMDGDRSHATTLGRIIGTPASLAPEMAAGEAIDHRADQYSLGVLLFEMLTLRRAWVLDGRGGHQPAYDGPIPQISENRPLGLFQRICSAARPDVQQVRPDLPLAIANVVKKALAAEATDRYESVAAFSEATRIALAGVVLAEVDATYVVERGRRRGSTVAPPGPEEPEHTGVVPRRASSLVIASRDVSEDVEIVDPANLPTRENAIPPRPAQARTQTIELYDPTKAPTDAVEVVSRPRANVDTDLEVNAPTPIVMTPSRAGDPSEPPEDPTPHVVRPAPGAVPVAFQSAPDTAAIYEVPRPVVPPPSERGRIVALAVGVGVALALLLVFGLPFGEEAPRAETAPAVQPTATVAPKPPPVVAPPPIEPVREPAKKRRRRRVKDVPIEAPAPAPIRTTPPSHLRGLLTRVKSSPSDTEALESLASGIESEARALGDGAERKRIMRMVASSRVMADVAGLERALVALERAAP